MLDDELGFDDLKSDISSDEEWTQGTLKESGEESPDDELVLVRRSSRRKKKDTTLAPERTPEGELTVWGLVCQNIDQERRKLKRRAAALTRQAKLKKAEVEQRQRSALLAELDGNEALADIFCGVPKEEEQTNVCHFDVKRNTVGSTPNTEAAPDTETLDIFNNATTTDPLDELQCKNEDEWSRVLGTEVEFVSGDTRGRLAPFAGAYRKGRRHVWTEEESEVFREGLERYGTDFMLIYDLVRKVSTTEITERDVVAKFRRECLGKKLLKAHQ
eukprot:Blabericola_migrator_1__7985@NODE_409_length_8743_cov_452_402259_g322_i0_p6_GENE_NODE_409_length_8743_cov_452_402259_g322_i0NODE_409_length_8743_cov_452_402259_g322_i0_p6_ORF_typecomplete_len273_score41_06Myb_DNAbind_7/PF15963_5/2_5e03Myb_DNAbind_7/PF15963_5/3_8e07Myb_DNAbinding/PF00249_31/0_022_NODE_409_length_8743_cov_452_402259_g322_i059816799